ncbi:uncharacterized protein [Choristoneura fumiferana]|uniref:uncharacterized protein n=1 Tax=Choristoneura fumiferana TaxID=7141 RepID=UPI003D15D2CA
MDLGRLCAWRPFFYLFANTLKPNNYFCGQNLQFQAAARIQNLLVTERPLRAEVERERRLSQRASLLTSSAPHSNRDSLGTTDSNQEDEEPPPLPEKSSHRSFADSDNNNNPEPLPPRHNYDTVWTPRGSFLYNSMMRRQPNGGPTPPTPPPKKKHAQQNS